MITSEFHHTLVDLEKKHKRQNSRFVFYIPVEYWKEFTVLMQNSCDLHYTVHVDNRHIKVNPTPSLLGVPVRQGSGNDSALYLYLETPGSDPLLPETELIQVFPFEEVIHNSLWEEYPWD